MTLMATALIFQIIMALILLDPLSMRQVPHWLAQMKVHHRWSPAWPHIWSAAHDARAEPVDAKKHMNMNRGSSHRLMVTSYACLWTVIRRPLGMNLRMWLQIAELVEPSAVPGFHASRFDPPAILRSCLGAVKSWMEELQFFSALKVGQGPRGLAFWLVTAKGPVD